MTRADDSLRLKEARKTWQQNACDKEKAIQDITRTSGET